MKANNTSKKRSRTLAFCGVEQEFNFKYPHEHSPHWMENGGKVYKDGVTEYNTPIIPIFEKGDVDASTALYNAIFADRARALKSSGRKNITAMGMHFNFSMKSTTDETFYFDVLRVLGPALSLAFGTSSDVVTFRNPDGRFEVCTGYLNSDAGIMGGAAIGIAALTALTTGELKLSDFEYRLAEESECITSTTDTGRKREEICFIENYLVDEGRDCIVMTEKGEATIDEIFSSTLKTLKPYVIKYCSRETYNLLKKIANGQVDTDLDADLAIINEGECSHMLSNHKFTKKRVCGSKSLDEVISSSKPESDARLFSLLANPDSLNLANSDDKTKKFSITYTDLSWQEITVKTAYGEESCEFNLSQSMMGPFYEILMKYSGKPKELDSILRFAFTSKGKYSEVVRLLNLVENQGTVDKDNFLNTLLNDLVNARLLAKNKGIYVLRKKGKDILDMLDPVVNINQSDLKSRFLQHVFGKEKSVIRSRISQADSKVRLIVNGSKKLKVHARAYIDYQSRISVRGVSSALEEIKKENIFPANELESLGYNSLMHSLKSNAESQDPYKNSFHNFILYNSLFCEFSFFKRIVKDFYMPNKIKLYAKLNEVIDKCTFQRVGSYPDARKHIDTLLEYGLIESSIVNKMVADKLKENSHGLNLFERLQQIYNVSVLTSHETIDELLGEQFGSASEFGELCKEVYKFMNFNKIQSRINKDIDPMGVKSEYLKASIDAAKESMKEFSDNLVKSRDDANTLLNGLLDYISCCSYSDLTDYKDCLLTPGFNNRLAELMGPDTKNCSKSQQVLDKYDKLCKSFETEIISKEVVDEYRLAVKTNALLLLNILYTSSEKLTNNIYDKHNYIIDDIKKSSFDNFQLY